MPTPIAMSTSEAEYMAACSASMATAHIRMLLYGMIYLGTKQWRESAQCLPTSHIIHPYDWQWSNCSNCQEQQTHTKNTPAHWTTISFCPPKPTRWLTPTTLDTLCISTCWHPHQNTSLLKDWSSSYQNLCNTSFSSLLHRFLRRYNSRGMLNIP